MTPFWEAFFRVAQQVSVLIQWGIIAGVAVLVLLVSILISRTAQRD